MSASLDSRRRPFISVLSASLSRCHSLGDHFGSGAKLGTGQCPCHSWDSGPSFSNLTIPTTSSSPFWNSRVTQNHHKSFDFCDTRRRRPYILTTVVPAKTEQRTWYRAIKPYLVSCADIAEARQSSADQRAYARVSILDAELISEEHTWDQSGSATPLWCLGSRTCGDYPSIETTVIRPVFEIVMLTGLEPLYECGAASYDDFADPVFLAEGARQMGASELFTRQSDGDLQSVSPMGMELVGDRSGVIGP
ncbi:hypothetical protein PISMIDRAFT_6592 [Pisolithus microcarpus 441]|uniref:Uncharacterized protein n=1 Tax=Pisolithus microcarpus 441 TaxID=765257 RepID=A0A0C9ZKF7_9AGAM|nr:hypothetical protein BKA83DRAFT_6592 [Pisolithus microcarpus]KIK29841.1 hypothetical protein PISMIDRAFT_6592 [Pisolithus microcarpus 441]